MNKTHLIVDNVTTLQHFLQIVVFMLMTVFLIFEKLMYSHHHKFHRTGLCCIPNNNVFSYNDAIYVHLDGSKNYFRILIPWLRLAYSLCVYIYMLG